jgi:hypothetical protein
MSERLKLRPTADARIIRVFDGRWPLGTIRKEPMGWRPDEGQITDICATKEAAAARLYTMVEARRELKQSQSSG